MPEKPLADMNAKELRAESKLLMKWLCEGVPHELVDPKNPGSYVDLMRRRTAIRDELARRSRFRCGIGSSEI